MNAILILFILSLLSIIVMIGRKVSQIRQGKIVGETSEEILFEIPYIDEVKSITTKGVRKYGYKALVITIRTYFRSANLVRYTYKISKKKVQNFVVKNIPKSESTEQESSKFLDTISEYKDKIKDIKHRISEEEKNL